MKILTETDKNEVEYTFAKSVVSNVVNTTKDWSYLCELAREPKLREKKGGPVIIPGCFIGDERLKDQAYKFQLFILDFDNKKANIVNLSLIKAKLSGWHYIAHTTFNHSVSRERWRVIIPLKRPVDSLFFKWVYKFFNHKFKNLIDPVSSNISQPYFMPSHHESQPYNFFIGHGEFFDIDQMGISPDLITTIEHNEVVSRRWNSDLTGLADESRSGLVFSMVSLLANKNFDEADILNVMTIYWDHGRNSPREIQRCLDKILNRSNRIQNTPFKLIDLGKVEVKNIEWLWFPYIPRGKLTLISGDPSVGKSYLMAAIVSSFSKGDLLPLSNKSVKTKSILFLAEDDIADTLVPRLKILKGDLSNIKAHKGNFTLDERGLSDLEMLVKLENPGLIILDPIMAYMQSDTDVYNEIDVRKCTNRLTELADKYNCAIIGIRHWTKGNREKIIYKGMGSIAFTAAARSEIAIATHKGKRVMIHVKHNLTEKGPSLYFDIQRNQDQVNFTWGKVAHISDEEILSNNSIKPVVDNNMKVVLSHINKIPVLIEDLETDLGYELGQLKPRLAKMKGLVIESLKGRDFVSKV